MARLCTQTLPSGKTCARVALYRQPYCPAHREADARQRTDDTRFLVENIRDMDPLSLTDLLLATLRDLRARRTPPLHAEAVFEAAAHRLEEIQEESQEESQHF